VHPAEMNKLTFYLYLVVATVSVSSTSYSQIQPVSKWIYDIGPSISFATNSIANNDAGIGIMGGVEKNVYKNISIGVETGFTYFIGDKSYSVEGKNKAYTIPLLAEVKVYFLSQFYLSPRAGAIYFLLNDQSRSHVRLAYGVTGGFNLPKKNNRINIQAGYTGFRHDSIQRGYGTLGAAIIIN
jgi:hypothetical protein